MNKVKKIYRVSLFVLFSVLFSVLIIGTRAEAAGKVHALVISGLNKYAEDSASRSCIKSTKTFHDNLVNSHIPDYLIEEENITFREWKDPDEHLLSDGRPFTTANFDTWLKLAFGHNESDALNIFYYAGHTGYLDSDPIDPKTYGIQVGPNAHTGYDNYVYRYSKLAKKLATYKGRFIVIIDACFAGSFYSNMPSNLRSRFLCILSSAEDKESQFETTTLFAFPTKKMQFTSRMNNGVNWKPLEKVYNADSNSDGVLTTTELFNYTKIMSPKVGKSRLRQLSNACSLTTEYSL